MTRIHSSTPPQSIFTSPKTEIASHSEANFCNCPAELVREFFKNIAKPYISIKTTHELASCMNINYESYRQIQWLLEHDPDIKAHWNKDKLFLTKLETFLKSDIDIRSTSVKFQTEWCLKRIFAILAYSTYTNNQIQFGIERIIKKVQHIDLSLPLEYQAQIKANVMILNALSKKTDIKKFGLIAKDSDNTRLDVYNFYRHYFMMQFLKILNNNSELHHILNFRLESDILKIEEIESLMQALVNKNIEYFEFGTQPIKQSYLNWAEEKSDIDESYGKEENAALRIFSKYSKDIKIKNLVADKAELFDPSISLIVKNFPAELETLSLKENYFHKEGLELIFENLRNTEVHSLDLSYNVIYDDDIIYLKGISHFLALKEVHFIGCRQLDPSNFQDIKNKYGEDINFIFKR